MDWRANRQRAIIRDGTPARAAHAQGSNFRVSYLLTLTPLDTGDF